MPEFSQSLADIPTLRWKSATHAYRKRSMYELREAVFRIGLIVLLAIFFRQFLFAAVVIAFSFVVFMLNNHEPEEEEHVIDHNGITTGGKTYVWEELDYYYFSSTYGQEMINVMTMEFNPKKISMLRGTLDKEKLQRVLEEFIPLKQEPEAAITERVIQAIAKWLSLN